MSLDERYLDEAEGYLELDLPIQAKRALDHVSAAGREEFAFAYAARLGETLRRLEQYAEAIPQFERARAEQPAELGCYINLGWCYKRTGQLPMAIEILLEAERVCRLAKDTASLPLVLFNLACYYSLAGDKESMLGYLRLAIDLAPKYRDSVPDESDFDPFRDDPDFIRLTSFVV